MVLCGVEINSVDTLWRTVDDIRENIITCRGDGEDHIVTVDLEDAVINPWVFPCESIDIRVVELGVFFQHFIIVKSPVVVLVEEAG